MWHKTPTATDWNSFTILWDHLVYVFSPLVIDIAFRQAIYPFQDTMAAEVKYVNFRRYMGLVLACIVISVSGSASTFINLATQLKYEFQLA